MRNIDMHVVYIPEGEREARGRDVVARRATPLDAPDQIDIWVADVDSHPTATLYQLERFPHVTIIYWHPHGRYTVKRERDGLKAAIDVSTFDEAMQAAYAYGAW